MPCSDPDARVAAATALIRQIEGRKASDTAPALEARLIRRGSVGSAKVLSAPGSASVMDGHAAVTAASR